MPALLLTDVEARILGSLVEKSYTTPDQYPLSLNALLRIEALEAAVKALQESAASKAGA